ncbi:MAG TPA: class I SAM-dependent methyltransferase [Acidobacteriota bacterium]
MIANTVLRRVTEQEVSRIFSDPDSDAAKRWIDYWASTETRNAELLAQFRGIVSLGFRGKTVLDVGCGTAGLAIQVEAEGGRYFGVDYSSYVLKIGQAWLRERCTAGNGSAPALMRASGCELPFQPESFDYIFALDVIEHLPGLPQQATLLNELRRLIRPMGMIFLTTPNRWYPFEGHTFLYFPQFLPTSLADRYIKKKNPGFLQEHGSFASIKLLAPTDLRRLLQLSRLSLLHQLPCCMDYEDFPLSKRICFRALGILSLSWYPLQEFWGCLTREEDREALQVKRGKCHRIALQESLDSTREFSSEIDFDRGPEAHQLQAGWFAHERTERGFRWTTGEAQLWLQAEGEEEFLSVSGHYDAFERGAPATLTIHFDTHWMGEHSLTPNEDFCLRLLLPYQMRRLQICTIRLAVHPCHTPGGSDRRRLGVAINQVGLVPALGNRLDFDLSPESHKLGKGWFAREQEERGFRWTADQAEAWLQAKGNERFVFVLGHCNALDRGQPVTLAVYFDGHWIGEHRLTLNEKFRLRFLLPYQMRPSQVCTIRFAVHPCSTPGGSDQRKLGVAIYQVRLIHVFGNQLDFNLGPESHKLGKGWFALERGFRWTGNQSEVWLQAAGNENFLFISGYCNASERGQPVTLSVSIDQQTIGQHRMEKDETFNLHLPLRRALRGSAICPIGLSVDPCFTPAKDQRKLGVAIFAVSLYQK